MNQSYGYINRMYGILKCGGYQRTLHYHNTPGFHQHLYEKQLTYIKEHYVTYGTEDLAHKKERDIGVQKSGKQSMVIGLFDGYRNNYDVMFPALEKYGLKAWYLLVADFLNTPVEEQERMLEPYLMQYYLGEYTDRRYAMSWDEAREVSQNHVIVNHSSTHYFMKPDTDEQRLKYEIYHSHDLIEKNAGICPKVFSWLGGAEFETNVRASKMLRGLGYQYLIGYELEDISEETAACCHTQQEPEMRITEDVSRLEEEIRYHQSIIEEIGIFSAVPAILPFYHVDNPLSNGESGEDLELAQHFMSLAVYLKERLSFDEWNAAHKALDILAVNMIGKDFPYHE